MPVSLGCLGASENQHMAHDDRARRDGRRAVRRSEDPRPDRQPRTAGADRRRRVHQRPAPRAVLRRVDRLRRASRLRRRRRHPPRRLAAVRAHRSLLRQAVRGRHQHQLHDPVRHLEVDEVRERRRLEARVRIVSRRLPRPTSRTGSATASASSPSTTTSSRTCRRRRSTSTWCCTRSTGRRPSGPAT